MVEFFEEECPKCQADAEECDACRGTGRFKQVVLRNWSPPILRLGEKMVAYLDDDCWSGIVVLDADGEVIREMQYPFATDFATPRHFEALGFEVDW